MKVSKWKMSAMAVVLGVSVFGSSCSRGSKHSGSAGVAPVVDEEEQVARDSSNREANTGEEDYSAAFSVLNFRQLAAAYERATGVAMEGPVMEEYNRQLASLPSDPDPTSVSASQVSAATKLAAAFCDVLSEDQNIRSQRFPDIDFNSPVANSDAFADIILETFFGPATSLQGDRAMDVATVAELTDYLVTVPNAQTTAVFMGACTAALSSAEYYLF